MARTGNKFSLSGRLGLNADNFDKGLRKAGRTFDSFQRNIRDKNHILGKSFRKSFSSIDSGINKVFKYGTAAGVGAVTVGLGLAAREFVNFDQAVVGATAKFKDLKIGTKEYNDTMIVLRKTARSVADSTQFTPTQAAEGLNFYAKAGFTSAEAMGVLKNTVDLATVAEMDFNRTADISSDLLASFGLNAEDSATKISNLMKMNRALGLTVNLANVNLEDMFETLKGAAPIATTVGASMNSLLAITGALGGAGIKGTLAETAIKNIYGRMISPTKDILNTLASINLQQKDFLNPDGSMDIVKIMDKVGKATKNLSKVKRAGVFFDLFGLRAVAGASNLANSLSQVQEIVDKLEGNNQLSTIADEMRKGLLMQLQILGSAALEKAFQFFDAFTSNGKDGIKKLTEAIRNLDVTPLVEFAKTVMSVLSFIGRNWEVLLSLAIGFKAVSIALGLVSFAGLAITGPIGAAILAIGALAMAITALIANYSDLEEGAKKANEAIAGTSRGKKTNTGQIPYTPMYGGMGFSGYNQHTYKQSRNIEQEPQILNSAYKDSITPKPMTYTNYDYSKGSLDINFNNMPQNAEIKRSGNFSNSNIKINPVLQP